MEGMGKFGKKMLEEKENGKLFFFSIKRTHISYFPRSRGPLNLEGRYFTIYASIIQNTKENKKQKIDSLRKNRK